MDIRRHLREDHGINALNANLRQIVYGGNDGIVTTFAVVAGFAGAGAEGAAQIGAAAVLLFGLANILADGAAMGLGEFLSSRSEDDVYDATRRGELRRLEEEPEEERQEVFEILKLKGLDEASARAFADELLKHPDLAADFMMNYEFGMASSGGGSSVWNGVFTFLSFVFFGAIPLFPYFLSAPSPQTFGQSIFATFGALSALGLLRWRATRERALRCVLETVAVGGTCAIVAYGVGWAVGG